MKDELLINLVRAIHRLQFHPNSVKFDENKWDELLKSPEYIAAKDEVEIALCDGQEE